MIEHGWDDYRAWALRSRTIQEERWRWNRRALACAVLAASLGAVAADLGTAAAAVRIGQLVSALAAVAAVASPIVGRYVLDLAGEASWIRARATAEAIKAECFRAAGRIKPYDGADARDVFIARRAALIEVATKAGLTALPDPAGAVGDTRRPPEPMDAAWYLANRVGEQAQYYAKRQRDKERESGRIRLLTLTLSLLAAALGAIGSTYQVGAFAPWIAVMTTIGAMVLANGALERRHYLAVSFGTMAEALGHIKERYDVPGADLTALVHETEALLSREHVGWAEQMTKSVQTTHARPPVADPGTRPTATF